MNNLGKYIKTILSLIKHRLSLMVTLSSVVGYILAPGDVNFLTLTGVFAGVFLLAGGSCGINQYQEKELDSKMARTRNRPIPSGKISAGLALFISLFMAFLGFQLLLFIEEQAAFLGILNVIFYNLLYTPLKTKTPLSIIPGAVVGAVPPMIGWAAAGGNLLHPNILFIDIFMFSWQLPHFWLLLIMYGKEYEKAGYPSISKYLNHNQIKYLVFFWTLSTSAFIFTFPLFEFRLNAFLVALLIITNIGFILMFKRLLFNHSGKKTLRKAFVAINSFMLLVLLIFIFNLLT